MSANLTPHNDRLCVLRVGGVLKKSELDAVQSEFAQKITPAETAGLRKGPVKFFPENGESDARAWLAE